MSSSVLNEHPYNDPLLRQVVYAILTARKDPRTEIEEVFRILAEYQNVLRLENARMKAQIAEILSMQPAATILLKTETF